MAATTTVRVNRETHLRLQELAREAGITMPELVARLVEADWRQQLFDRADEAYAALQGDTDAWDEELAERRTWEATLADGLADDASSNQAHPTTATELA